MRTNEAAGGIVLGPQGSIIVVEQHGNSWCFPKGGVEQGESLLDAARREIAEETGVGDLLLLRELGSYERKSIAKNGVGETDEFGTRKRTFFLFKTSQTELAPQDGEVTQARWASLDEAAALLTHPKDREFFASIRPAVEAALQ